MKVAAVGGEDQAGRAALVVELHGHGDFVRHGGDFALVQAERASAEAFAQALDGDTPGLLRPTRAEQRLPLAGVQVADGEPARDGDGVGLGEEGF